MKLKESLGRVECPYAQRWILNLGIGSIRVHRWFRSDDKRYLHDHPWWFFTLCVKGGYRDVSEQYHCKVCGGELYDGWCVSHEYEGEQRVRNKLWAGSMRFRRAHHRHYVEVDPGGAWTVLVTGPKRHQWGFYVKNKFKKSSRYFFDFGHPPCDEP